MLQDWRRKEDYEYCRALTPHAWAWEFLRRNDSYRAAWREYKEASEAWRVDTSDKAAMNRLATAQAARLNFGVGIPLYFEEGFEDPDKPALSVRLLWTDPVGIAIVGTQTLTTRLGDSPWPGFPHRIALAFEFTKPLEPQVEHAVRLLRECERRVRETSDVRAKVPKIRFDSQRFTLYVRLLDARAAQASIGEMGRVLFRGKADPRRSAKDALRKALTLAEVGYRDLLLMANLLTPSKGRGR